MKAPPRDDIHLWGLIANEDKNGFVDGFDIIPIRIKGGLEKFLLDRERYKAFFTNHTDASDYCTEFYDIRPYTNWNIKVYSGEKDQILMRMEGS